MSSPNSVWYTIFTGPVLIEHVDPGTHDHDCRLANDIATPVSPIGSFVSVLNSLMPFEFIPRNTCSAMRGTNVSTRAPCPARKCEKNRTRCEGNQAATHLCWFLLHVSLLNWEHSIAVRLRLLHNSQVVLLSKRLSEPSHLLVGLQQISLPNLRLVQPCRQRAKPSATGRTKAPRDRSAARVRLDESKCVRLR